jgi:hypothetical protein
VTVNTARRNAFALFALALFVQLGLTAGWREEAASLAEEQRRAMTEQRAVSRKLADLQKRSRILQKAGLRNPGPAPRLENPIQAVRAGVVRSLQGVRNVQLDVRPASAPAHAFVSLGASGPLLDLVRLVSILGEPGHGLLMQRVSLAPQGETAALHLDAVAVALPAGEGGRP